MDDAEISDVFQDVFGATPNETLATYAASTKDNYPGTGPFGCGQGERVAWNGNRAAWSGKIKCTDSHTIGEYRGDGKVKPSPR
jgi:hypothetical protein